MLSTEFAAGWAAVSPGRNPATVFAMLDNEVIGLGTASISRFGLDHAGRKGMLEPRAFTIVFSRPVPAEAVQSITVFAAGHVASIPRAETLKLEATPPLRIFVMGSPRSGTSELARTLSKVLGLPWKGEGHVAPLFHRVANDMSGDASSENALVRFLAQQNFRNIAIEAARLAYYTVHRSASFLDETPGFPMIMSAPFLSECFPGSHFIFLRRNPVSNVLSRMVKFGGSFEAHCKDWTAAMKEWLKTRPMLPHYLEIEQEQMLLDPDRTARAVADYIKLPDKAPAIAESLKGGSTQRTGAGIGKTDESQTGWSPGQLKKFEDVCGPTMRMFGYKLQSSRDGADLT
jgi:hypothetical protein